MKPEATTGLLLGNMLLYTLTARRNPHPCNTPAPAPVGSRTTWAGAPGDSPNTVDHAGKNRGPVLFLDASTVSEEGEQGRGRGCFK